MELYLALFGIAFSELFLLAVFFVVVEYSRYYIWALSHDHVRKGVKVKRQLKQHKQVQG